MHAQNTTLQNVPLGMAYVPMQKLEKRYSDELSIIRGTIFPDLDLPFQDYVVKSELPKTPLCQVMKHDFVCFDLGLYLDTHPDDKETINYYNQCLQKSMDARKDYEQDGGHLSKGGSYAQGGNWVDDPWPWDYM